MTTLVRMVDDVTITLDPQGHYPEEVNSRLMGACGVLPQWSVAALVEKHEQGAEAVKDAVQEQYCFPVHKIHGATITPVGTYKYPDDPDMEPYMSLRRGNVEVLIYGHAIIAFRERGGDYCFVTRMD